MFWSLAHYDSKNWKLFRFFSFNSMSVSLLLFGNVCLKQSGRTDEECQRSHGSESRGVLCASYVGGFWVGQIPWKRMFSHRRGLQPDWEAEELFVPHGGSHLVKEAIGLLGWSEEPLKDGQDLNWRPQQILPGEDPDWLKNKVGIHPQCLNTLNTSENLGGECGTSCWWRLSLSYSWKKKFP